jgi:hypothetical protein
MQNGIFIAAISASILMTAVGCTNGPKRVEVPDFDPDQIAVTAIELNDKDGDGALSATELEEVKSLKSAMKRLDVDQDGSLTSDEIAARIRAYQEYRSGLAQVDCKVVRGGKPVAGAMVTYEPEKFMGDSLVAAQGTTDGSGGAVISVADEHLPSPAYDGARPGFYRVRVTLADGTEVANLDAGAECAGDVFNSHHFTLP